MSSNSFRGNPFKRAASRDNSQTKKNQDSKAKSPFEIAEKEPVKEKSSFETAEKEPAKAKSPFEIAEKEPVKATSPFEIAEKEPQQELKKEPVQELPKEQRSPQASSEPVKEQPLPDAKNQNTTTTKKVNSNNTNTASSVSAMCLRAIYGLAEDLDAEGLIEKANTLNGVQSLTLISRAEIEALELINTQHFGLNGCTGLKLTVDNGDLKFITVGDAHLAVITNSGYEAGVEETINLTAERIAEIS